MHCYFSEPLPHDDNERAKLLFLNALKEGRGFISNFRRDDARGTRIVVEYADGTIAFPGPQPVNAPLPALLHVSLVDKADIRFIRNGQLCARQTGTEVLFNIEEKGLYRIEVYRKKNAWIYSNPFPIGTYPLW